MAAEQALKAASRQESSNLHASSAPSRPVLDIPDETTSLPKLKRMARMLDALYTKVMQEGTDYDTMPGTSKPGLLKAGAELLARAYNLVSDTQIVKSVEKTDQEVPYFQFDAECRLYNARGEFVGNGLGSCNTCESRYRHAWVGEEDLPKKNVKNPEDPQTRDVAGSKQYRVPLSRDEAFDLVNAVMKIAAKRAFVDAVLKVTASSRLFTQDVGSGEEPNDSSDGDYYRKPRQPVGGEPAG